MQVLNKITREQIEKAFAEDKPLLERIARLDGYRVSEHERMATVEARAKTVTLAIRDIVKQRKALTARINVLKAKRTAIRKQAKYKRGGEYNHLGSIKARKLEIHRKLVRQMQNEFAAEFNRQWFEEQLKLKARAGFGAEE